MKKNIALTGGGTGGHIYPSLAVAEAIKELVPDARLFYIGNSNKLEAQLLNSDDLKDPNDIPYSSYIEFCGILAEPLPRNPLKLPLWLYRFGLALSEAQKHLEENAIDMVFGTGGYVAAPIFAACIILKIPYVIHNLDAHMGLANLAFIHDAKALTLAFPGLNHKPKNEAVYLTGNPISKKFTSQIKDKPKDGTLNLLITGGSQGAQSINDAIGEILPELTKMNINIFHITGAKLYDEYIEKFLGGNVAKYSNYRVAPYTHEMPKLCSYAHLAICRSGAMTIAEMAASEVVPIFVPLPWAAHDHQNKNAQSLVDAGAALSLNQDDENFKYKLLQALKVFTENDAVIDEFSSKLKSFRKPEAAKDLAKLVLS